MSGLKSVLHSRVALMAIAWGTICLGSAVDVRGDDAKDEPSAEDLAELTADWWQWLYGQPVSVNPALDTTGAFAQQGQTGDVFFLAGAIAPLNDPFMATVTRSITVPPGKAIFFPVLNAEAANKDTPPGGMTEAGLRALIAAPLDAATGLYATLDGVSIAPLIERIKSGPFSYTLPKGFNLDQFFGVNITGKVDGTVSDGYWVYLPPLSKKTTHTLTFGGSTPPRFPSR